jgi:putative endonuclease
MLERRMSPQEVLLHTACATISFPCATATSTFWVYIMASSSGTLNIGVTGFFEQRIVQHKTGTFEGFSKKYGCTRLVYYEGYDEAAKAIGREKQLKGWRREKKIALIEKMNPRWQDLAEHLGSEVLFPGQTQGSLALMQNRPRCEDPVPQGDGRE